MASPLKNSNNFVVKQTEDNANLDHMGKLKVTFKPVFDISKKPLLTDRKSVV